MNPTQTYPPPARPFTTIGLVAACVLVWLAQLAVGIRWLLPSPQQLLPWGADMPLLALTGQGWRVATAMFLHGGLLHLGLNMLALATVGPRAERQFGSIGALLLYLGGGLLSACVTLGWALWRAAATGEPGRLTAVHVGASGAVMAILGGLFAASWLGMPERGEKEFPRMVDWPIVIVVALNLGMGALLPLVDNISHAGGVLGGLAIGLLLALGTPRRLRPTRVLAIVLLVGAALALLLHGGHPELAGGRALGP